MDNFKNIFVWVVLLVLLVSLVKVFEANPRSAKAENIEFSEFVIAVKDNRVESVIIKRDPSYYSYNISGKYRGTDREFQTVSLLTEELINDLLKNGNVKVKVESPDVGSGYSEIIKWIIPMVIFALIWLFIIRQMQGGGGRAMGFGKSKAKLLNEAHGKVTFADVAGVNEAKEELQEVVEFLRDPSKFQKLGGKIPKGALLVGPPGTGKTLLARAVAGEANVPFFTISGSDFVEMFVGVGASRVRDMFEQAKRNAPCIIFIDEIDAVGRHRGAGLGGGNDEREQTLNQLLVEMDGFETNEGVILIAATNRPDVLDPALLRPGRFDREVVVGNPDIMGREQILKVHMRKIPLAPDVDPKIIARGTPGFSGADLANLVNEAALLAARRSKRLVTQDDFEDAKDKVMMGSERRSMVMTDEEKELTAYHEGGHALVTLYQDASDPIHKATIIPRGRALGMVMRLPERDQYSETRAQLKAHIAIAMGGRIAEEVIFGYDKVTSGASQDIVMATRVAKMMVTKFGMSDKLGPLAYDENEEEVFLGHSVTKNKNLSDDTQKVVDSEVRKFVDEGYKTAEKIINEHIEELHVIAKALLEYETLSGDEIKALLKGEQPVRDNIDDEPLTGSAVPSTGSNSKNSTASKEDKNSKNSGKAEDGNDMEPQTT